MMTADGRTVDVPDGLAGQFRGLTPMPAAPPPLPVAPPAPEFAPVDVPPPELAKKPEVTPEPAAVTSPTQMPEPPIAKTGPITKRDIATMGDEVPLNLQVDAITDAKRAAERLGQAMGDQAMAVSAVETEANDVADRQLAEIQRTSEANAKAVEDATANYIQNSKRIADIKVDYGIDHPLMAAIGVAFNVIGTAMAKGDMSKVMDPIYRAIDRKVAAQVQSIEQGRAGLALQREALGMLKQTGNDRVALQNTFMLSGLEQAKRRVQEVRDKSTSPIAKAQADQVIAQFDVNIADKIDEVRNREQQRQDALAARDQAEKLARAQMGVTMRGQDIEQQGRIDAIAAQIALAKNDAAARAAEKGQTKAAEDIQKRGIGGEMAVSKDKDGNVIYKDDGTPEIDVGLITKKNGDVWIPTGTDTTISELQKQHPAVAGLIGTIDEIRRLGPEWLSDTSNSDKKQKLDQLFSAAKSQATAVLGLGVPTGRDIELATGALGTTDPTRFRSSLAGLNQARNTFLRVHQERLKAAGLDKEWRPPDLANVPKAPIDAVRTMLRAKPDVTYEKAFNQALGYYYPKDKVSDAQHREAVARATEEAKSFQEISPKQRRTIEKLIEQGIAGDRKAISALTDISSGEGVASDTVKRLASEAISVINSDIAEREAKSGKYEPISDTGPQNIGYNPETLGRRFQAPPSKPTIEPFGLDINVPR